MNISKVLDVDIENLTAKNSMFCIEDNSYAVKKSVTIKGLSKKPKIYNIQF